MQRRARLGLTFAILFCCPVPYAEAGLNKCTDGKQITYTNEPCEKTGLKAAGPIKDAVTVMPLVPRPANDPSGKTGNAEGDDKALKANAPSNVDPDADVKREVTIKPVSPLVDKMLKW